MMPYRHFLAAPGVVERTRNFLRDYGCVIDAGLPTTVCGFGAEGVGFLTRRADRSESGVSIACC